MELKSIKCYCGNIKDNLDENQCKKCLDITLGQESSILIDGKEPLSTEKYEPTSKFQNLGFCNQNVVTLQTGGTCYAHASANIVRMIYSRIVGLQVPSFELLKNKFVKQGEDGGLVEKCLQDIPYIHYNEVNFEKVLKIIKVRPVLFTWRFYEKEWNIMEYYTEKLSLENSEVSFEMWKNHKDFKIRETGKIDGHAVVITDIYRHKITKEYLLQIKNSWGTNTSHQGIFHLSSEMFSNFKYYDVFFYEEELSDNLKNAYKKFLKSGLTYEDYVKESYAGNFNNYAESYCLDKK